MSSPKKKKAAEKGVVEWKELDLDEDTLGGSALKKKAGEKLAAIKSISKMGVSEAKRALVFAATQIKNSELAEVITEIFTPTNVSLTPAEIREEKRRLGDLRDRMRYDPDATLKDILHDLDTHDAAYFVKLKKAAVEAGEWQWETPKARRLREAEELRLRNENSAAKRLAEERSKKEAERMAKEGDKAFMALMGKINKDEEEEEEKEEEQAPGKSKLWKRASIRAMAQVKGRKLSMASLIKLVALSEETVIDEVVEEDQPICKWRKVDKETKARYKCNNECIRDAHTHMRLPTCGYHTEKCGMPHALRKGGQEIEVPNEDGLCLQHYEGKHMGEPRTYEDWKVLPGVERIVPRRQVTVIKAHPLAPNYSHPDDLSNSDSEYYSSSDEYESSEEEEDAPLYDEMKDSYAAFKAHQLTLKRSFMGKAMWMIQRYFGRLAEMRAVQIQVLWRGHYVRKSASEVIKEDRLVVDRLKACRQIQRYGRGYNGRKVFRAHRKICKDASTHVQKVCRGHLARCYYRRHWAAKRIQKLFKRYLAVQMLATMRLRMQAMMDEQLREWGVTVIQRFWRGALARMEFARRRAYFRLCQWAAAEIQRIFRGHLGRERWKAAWERMMLEQRALIMIQKVVRGWLDRRRVAMWRALATKTCRFLQRIYRGHLGRCERDRRLFAVEAWWSWLDPHLPREYYEHGLKKHFMHPEDGIIKPIELDPMPSFNYNRLTSIRDLLLGLGGMGAEQAAMAVTRRKGRLKALPSNPNEPVGNELRIGGFWVRQYEHTFRTRPLGLSLTDSTLGLTLDDMVRKGHHSGDVDEEGSIFKYGKVEIESAPRYNTCRLNSVWLECLNSVWLDCLLLITATHKPNQPKPQ
jgi:hypothetical protein